MKTNISERGPPGAVLIDAHEVPSQVRDEALFMLDLRGRIANWNQGVPSFRSWKEHLAASVPTGAALVLDTLPWPTDIRSLDELELAAIGKTAADLKPAELKMAAKLINDMTDSW